MKNEIYLTKNEIKRLIIQSEKLDRLEANGVDNWDGYNFSSEYNEWEDIDDYEERINKSELIIRN